MTDSCRFKIRFAFKRTSLQSYGRSKMRWVDYDCLYYSILRFSFMFLHYPKTKSGSFLVERPRRTVGSESFQTDLSNFCFYYVAVAHGNLMYFSTISTLITLRKCKKTFKLWMKEKLKLHRNMSVQTITTDLFHCSYRFWAFTKT